MACEAELCRNWTGQGCICEVLGLEPDVVEPLEYSGLNRSFDDYVGMGDA